MNYIPYFLCLLLYIYIEVAMYTGSRLERVK